MDVVNVAASERVDLNDFTYQSFTSQLGFTRENNANFVTNPTGQQLWVINGFAMSNPSGSQIQVDGGVAMLAYRDGATVYNGVLQTGGDTFKIIDVSTYAPNTYTIYIRFNYTPGSYESRAFWNASNNGSEISASTPTRMTASWELRLELVNPGAEWLAIGTVNTTGTPAITDMRPLYFEGRVDQGYARVWGTGPNDRDSDRATYGLQDLQTFVQAMQQCLTDIKGQGIANWFTPYVAGMNVGFADTPIANQVNVGDVNFGLQFQGGSPALQMDTETSINCTRGPSGNLETFVLSNNVQTCWSTYVYNKALVIGLDTFSTPPMGLDFAISDSIAGGDLYSLIANASASGSSTASYRLHSAQGSAKTFSMSTDGTNLNIIDVGNATRLTIDSTGHIGINGGSGGAALQVNAIGSNSTLLSLAGTTSSAGAFLNIYSGSTSPSELVFYGDTGNTQYWRMGKDSGTVWVLYDAVGAQNAIQIYSNQAGISIAPNQQNVSIGSSTTTTFPLSLVSSSTTYAYSIDQSAAGAGSGGIIVKTPSTNNAGIMFGDASVAQRFFFGKISTTDIVIVDEVQGIRAFDWNSPSKYLLLAGNSAATGVTIGSTNAPTGRLTVSTPTNLGSATGSTYEPLRFEMPDGGNYNALRFWQYRHATGSTFSTADVYLQKFVDSTVFGHIGFYTTLGIMGQAGVGIGYGATGLTGEPASPSLFINSSGNIVMLNTTVPGATATYDIGTASILFRNAYFSAAVQGGSLLASTSVSTGYSTVEALNTSGSFPGARLSLTTPFHDWHVRSRANSDRAFDIFDNTNGNTCLYIDTSGNVALGNNVSPSTSTPASVGSGLSFLPGNTSGTTTMLTLQGDIYARGGFKQTLGPFTFFNTSANNTTTYTLTMPLNGSGGNGTNSIPGLFVAPFSGSIVGISLQSAGTTAAIPNVTVLINGSTTIATLTTVSGSSANSTTFVKDAIPFLAGNSITCTVAYTGSASLTASVLVWLVIEM